MGLPSGSMIVARVRARTVGDGRLEDLAAVSYNLFEGSGHVSHVDPEHRTGVPGRGTVFHPLADEAWRLEVRVVRFDLPAEHRLVERGRSVAVGRRQLQVADLAVNEAERPGGFGVLGHGDPFFMALRGPSWISTVLHGLYGPLRPGEPTLDHEPAG